MDALLSADRVWKSFGGAAALRGANFSARSGEIVGLLGANGAGKTTLVKILSGALAADSGDIRMGGRAVRLSSPGDAIAAGVRMLPQEISVFPDLSVAENIFAGNFPRRNLCGFPLADRRTARRRCRAALNRLGMRDVSPDAPMRRLRASERRLVEIARAVADEARVLILDEPTASLTAAESERLFAILARLRERGTGVVYISHYLDEVFRICSRVAVLRDGENAGEFQTDSASQEDALAAMLGTDAGALYPPRTRAPGGTVLEIRGLSVKDEVADADFSVRAGEIFGVFGLLGSGIAAVGRAVFGALGPCAREFRMSGASAPPRSPQEGLASGVGFVAAERKREGILPDLSLRENITLPFLRKFTAGAVVSRRRERAHAREKMRELDIRARGTEQAAKNLSGGNQQKMCLARWLSGDVRLLALEEPTRGVDVGARGEIYAKLRELADGGMAALLVSSDAEEVAGLADRSIVLARGRVAARFEAPADAAALIRAAAGLAERSAA